MGKEWTTRYDEYLDYLQSDRWRTLRYECLMKDKFRCAICGCTKQLEVHHLAYPTRFGEESINDLITVCRGCHADLETLKKSGSIMKRKTKVSMTAWIRVKNREEAEKAVDIVKHMNNGDIHTMIFCSETNESCKSTNIDFSEVYKAKSKFGSDNVTLVID